MARNEIFSLHLPTASSRPRAASIFHAKQTFAQFKRPHDLQNLYVNLRQWRILHAVIDCNGFSEAAEYLHMSQSAVSYTVSKLQEQLGLQLLTTGKRPQLTPAGRSLLDRSRFLLKEAVELEQHAEKLRHGREVEINLIVDTLFPSELLMKAMASFSAMNLRAPVRLREVATSGIATMLREAQPDIAISASVPVAFLGEPLLRIKYVAVAHSSHPLMKLQRPVRSADLTQHIRIETDSLDPRIASSSQVTVWSMGTIQAAIRAVQAGLGYGWLPRHHVEKLIADGVLAEIPLEEDWKYEKTLYLIQARQRPPQPAYTELIELLRGLRTGAENTF